MTSAPLVSIIMPSFNQAELIGRSIDSVFSQDYPHIELIISDGASSDRTVEVLQAKSAAYPRLRWTSQKDSGPAEALNLALEKTRGTVIGWLNSDDLYTPGAVRRAMVAFARHPEWIMCYGHGEHIDIDDGVIGPYPTEKPSFGLQGFAAGCFICQPTVFFKRTMYGLLGPLDKGSRTSFDFDYWLRAFRAFPERIGFVDAVQAQSRLHADCITLRLRRTIAVEGVQVTCKHLGEASPHWLISYIESISRMSAEERGFDDLGGHVSDLLDEVSPFMDPGSLLAVRASVENTLAACTIDVGGAPR